MYSVKCIKPVRWSFGYDKDKGQIIVDMEPGQTYNELSVRDYNELIQKGYAKPVGKKPPDLNNIVCINPYVADRGKAARARIKKEEEENQKKKIKRTFDAGESFYPVNGIESKADVADHDQEDYDEEEVLFQQMEEKVKQRKSAQPISVKHREAPVAIKQGFQDDEDDEFEDIDIDADDEDFIEEKMLDRQVENKMLNHSAQNKRRGRPSKQAAA